MTIKIAAQSSEYVPVTVEVRQGGVTLDPTDQDVWLAFVPEGTAPDDGDWVVGEWVLDGGLEHEAIALASGLAAGRYDIWSRVDWPPEDRRGPSGKLVVT